MLVLLEDKETMVMLQDKTFKIKTYDHNDAVIYVTVVDYVMIDSKAKHSTNVVAVIPVNNGDGAENSFVDKVQKAAASLAELYQEWPDGEVKIHYVINSHPWVNV